MRRVHIGGVLALVAMLGCGEDIGIPQSGSLNANVAGVWHLTSGTLLSSASEGQLEYLELAPDGTGTAYNRFTETGILSCSPFTYAVLTDSTLLLELPERFRAATLLVYEVSNGALVIDEVSTDQSTFESEDDVPESSVCRELSNVTVFADLEPAPFTESGLVYDGALLWYSAADGFFERIYPFDPESGTIGTPLSWSFQAPLLGSFQAPNFWAHDSSSEARRLDIAAVTQDEVSLFDLDVDIRIEAMVWDGSLLWFHGFDRDTNKRRFIVIDSDEEPDALVDTPTFDIRVEALAWNGTHVLALVSRNGTLVVGIDPETLLAIATYNVPDPEGLVVRWNGIESVGDDLYLLGINQSTTPNTAYILKGTP